MVRPDRQAHVKTLTGVFENDEVITFDKSLQSNVFDRRFQTYSCGQQKQIQTCAIGRKTF